MKENRYGSRGLSLLPYSVFTILYYAPLILSLSPSVNDPRIESLLWDTITTPRVIIEIFLNISGHVILLALLFVLVHMGAKGIHRAFGLKPTFATWTTLLSSFILFIALNAHFFPYSQYNAFYESLTNSILWLPAASVPAFGILYFIYSEKKRIRKAVSVGKSVPAAPIAAATIVIASILYLSGHVSATQARESNPRPNIVIIGIDSLSTGILLEEEGNLPTIAGLYRKLTHYPNAFVPLARTYPAWITLLSGKPPAEHGAFFNLTDPSLLDRKSLLSNTLRKEGYFTLFAIDERRFCNIDESYGFDRVAGPKMGALDFMIQSFNDTPLTNIALQNKISRTLFGYSYMNTASHANYNEYAIIDEIGRMIDTANRAPLFLAVHFEAGHYPYKIGTPIRHAEKKGAFYASHIGSLRIVDRQVGELLDLLKRKNLLDDTLLILISDHGESLGYPEGRVIWMDPDREDSDILSYGHGTQLLSRQQNSIVLAMGRFRDGKAIDPSEEKHETVSLASLHDAILHYANTKHLPSLPHEECIFTETGIRFSSAANFKSLDKESLAKEAARFYEITPLGNLVIRTQEIPHLVSTKDFAVRCGNTLTRFSQLSQSFETFHIYGNNYHETTVDSDQKTLLTTYMNSAITRAISLAGANP